MRRTNLRRTSKSSVIFSIIATEAVGLLAGLLSRDASGYYYSLSRPVLSPPGWLFPVVWILLYALMGAAAGLVSDGPNVRPEEKGRALMLYVVQLAVNFLWTLVFFRWEALWLSVLVILVLDVLVVVTIIAFSRVEQAAASLLVPYLIWTLFATYLNIGVAILN